MGKVGELQTLEQKVAKVASTLKGWSYMYEGYASANEMIGRKSLPCIINVLPETGMLVSTPTQQVDQSDCIIAFVDKMDLDYDGQETDTKVVERLKRGAQAFIWALNDSQLFRPIASEVPYSVMFDQMDDTLCILAIRLTLRETYGIPYCHMTTVDEVLEYGGGAD